MENMTNTKVGETLDNLTEVFEEIIVLRERGHRFDTLKDISESLRMTVIDSQFIKDPEVIKERTRAELIQIAAIALAGLGLIDG